jgi:hypothetical protein
LGVRTYPEIGAKMLFVSLYPFVSNMGLFGMQTLAVLTDARPPGVTKDPSRKHGFPIPKLAKKE